ncbi:uncharacterized protein LOC141856836 [Brevipalpus obovatus]|uniref:uncharacterized protein LOC141856836 n=1 Tax=Brevipalpus obovatus TaxID=246614 RepID=UPI003D9F7397
MSLFEQPLTIQKIFDSLDPCDVYQCRLVSKIWYYEAIRWLKKYPPIDECAIVVRVTETHDTSIETEPSGTEEVDRSLIEILDSGDDKIREDGDVWWYLKRAESYQQVSKDFIDRAALKFFRKNGKRAPSFCFFQSNISSGAHFDRKAFNYLTLRVEEQISDDFPIIPCDDINLLASNDINEGIRSQISDQFKPCLYSYMNAFLVNSYRSGHKIMISDWADPRSPKPNPNDPENPIKSLIFLISSSETKSPYVITGEAYSYLVLMSKFAKYFDIYVTGGITNPRHRISFSNSSDPDYFQESTAISIAFIGKQVQSSVFKYNQDTDMKTFADGLLKFKSAVDYSTDVPGVFGFIFEENFFEKTSKCQKDYHERIFKAFPCVKFVKIMLRTTGCRARVTYPEATVVHLIRI